MKADRNVPRFSEGDIFKGRAFGQPVVVILDKPYQLDDGSWSWTAKTHLGGGADIADDILALDYILIGSLA